MNLMDSVNKTYFKSWNDFLKSPPPPTRARMAHTQPPINQSINQFQLFISIGTSTLIPLTCRIDGRTCQAFLGRTYRKYNNKNKGDIGLLTRLSETAASSSGLVEVTMGVHMHSTPALYGCPSYCLFCWSVGGLPNLV